jgi:hypothetical protein
MNYQAVSFPSLGAGLNLRDQSDTVSQAEAIDALNVEFTRAGAVQQRAGYTDFSTTDLTNRVDSLSRHNNGATEYVLVGNGNRIDILPSAGGATLATTTSPTASPHYFARFAAPGSEGTYIANGTDALRFVTGTTFSTPATLDDDTLAVSVNGKFLAVQQPDNRLVCANFPSTSANWPANSATKSTVRFSNAGGPLVWHDNSYVHLHPGDGEEIMGVVQWRELLFVFKRTKFFVFYGNSTDSLGNPVFNYRVVNLNVGLVASKALCAGPEGVYFLSQHGVYRTTGADAQLVSSAIDPIFFGDASPFYQGGTLLQSQVTNSQMLWHGERVYLAFTITSTTNSRLLVYDTRYQWWTLWDIPASALLAFDIPSGGSNFLFGYAAGDKDVGQYTGTATSDDGVAITSRWQSGWFDLGQRAVKTVRQTRVTGDGIVSMGNAVDYSTTPQIALRSLDFSVDQPLWDVIVWDEDEWGPVASFQHEYNRDATRGVMFSVMLQNSTLNQDWGVHKVDQYVREFSERSAVAA